MPGKPAARVTDPTTHGSPLSPGPGSPNTLIGNLPAWRTIIDQHACPAASISGADGVGSVVVGSPTVFINNQMACRIQDIVVEKPGLAMGPANPIVMGCPTVLIGEAGGGGTEGLAGPEMNLAQGGGPGSPPQKVAKTSLLDDPKVTAGLKAAAKDSDIGGKNPVEQGGFILKDPKTGQLSVERWPQGKGASMQPPMSADGTYNGKDIVGSFHTHPNVGPGWKQEPSNADVNFVKKYPKTAGPDHFVVSKDKIYHIDKNGSVSEAGSTASILK